MIIHLKPEVNKEKAEELGKELSAIVLPRNGFFALVTPNKLKAVEEKHKSFVSESFPFDDDMQLASKKYMSNVREIKIADGLSIGGNTNNTIMITGPCSVESEEQIEQASQISSLSFSH